jgi:hypothetical protein
MTALADIQSRIQKIQGRLRSADQGRRRRSLGTRKPIRCGRCREPGHTWGRCPSRDLRIWSNGAELWIARSAEDAAELERELDATLSDGDAVPTPPEAWTIHRRWKFVLTLQVPDGRRLQLPEYAWIKPNGRCLLAHGEKLAPGREVPR